MAVMLVTLDANADIDALTEAVRHQERLGLRLLSLAAGKAAGQRASLAAFRQGETGPHARPPRLQTIDDTLDLDAQQAILTDPRFECVCYGTLHVSGTVRNVAAFRAV